MDGIREFFSAIDSGFRKQHDPPDNPLTKWALTIGHVYPCGEKGTVIQRQAWLSQI